MNPFPLPDRSGGKPRVLVISADLEVGGIERSLLGLLGTFDYDRYDVDLMLWRHSGPFLRFLPTGPRLLPQIAEYSTFQRPIVHILREGHARIALARLRAKLGFHFAGQQRYLPEAGHLIFQRSWRYALKSLPKIPGEYTLALSFVGPHYTATDKVNARLKLGWIHTDYRMMPIDGDFERAVWNKLDYVAAVSDECRVSFLERFPHLSNKTIVIENILSPELVRRQAGEFDARSEMPPAQGVTRLLSVGRFSHAKGIDQAVLVCRKLVDQGYNIRWYAIGYGPDEAMIRRLIIEQRLEDRFVILGMRINPYPYVRTCELFVQPSRYEGKAVTVREAQILGKPILMTRFPTAASQIEEGVDGHICDLGVDGIVAGVRRLIDDPAYCRRIATTASIRDYSNKDQVEKVYQLIEDGVLGHDEFHRAAT
jgi:glycosyltransferase involved in cell wall biosynthesis